MKDLAVAIDAHLQRMEKDLTINVETSRDPGTKPGNGLRRFFGARAAYIGGRFIRVVYISYQGVSQLTKEDAEIYLDALDRGSTDRHHEVFRKAGLGR